MRAVESRTPSASGLRAIPVAERTMPALLRRQAETHGDAPFLNVGEASRTFQGMADTAARAAGLLASVGITRGERIAFLCGNRIELFDLFAGCAWSGAIAVPLNTAARGEQLQHMLHNSQPRALVIEADLLEILDDVALPDSLQHLWVPADCGPATGTYGHLAPATLPALGEPLAAVEIQPQETLAILYTSGTTGVSKGVCCPHAQLFWWGVLVGEALEIDGEDHLFTCLPLFHTNALTAVIQALLAGARCTIVGRFSASRFWAQAIEAEATVTYLLGTMIAILCNREADPLEQQHSIRVALAPGTPPQLFAHAQERLRMTLVEGYGSTELNLVTGAPVTEQRPGWMGKVLPEFEAIVADEWDQPVALGEPGELLVRPREPFSVATGYFAMDDKTVDAWRNLWFHTGDRVVSDTDGWLRFVDRSKDAIRRRGENISSFEVEAAIVSDDAVEAVAAYAVPSELGEDEVMVAVVAKHGTKLDPLSLIKHCEGRLAYFAIPRYIDVVEELPLTSNGKVRKAVLRERGITDATFDREAVGYQLKR